MADDYNIKDASGTVIAMRAIELAGAKKSNVVHIYAGSDVVATGNPFPVVQTGALPAGANAIGTVGVTSLPTLPAGTNNIGDVDVLTLPAIPTGTNSIGKVSIQLGGTDVSDSIPVPVKGGFTTVSGEFTRPADATAYAIGDVISSSTSAAAFLTISGCARVAGGSGFIVGAELVTDLKSITPSIRVHVFNDTPTQSVDNAARRALYADIAKRVDKFVLGPLSTPSDTTNSTLSQASDSNLRIPFKCAAGSTSLIFDFESLSAFTPASGQRFTLILRIDQN